MDRSTNLKEFWVTCPECSRVYHVERLFWEPQYSQVELICPSCGKSFPKERSPKTYGLPR